MPIFQLVMFTFKIIDIQTKITYLATIRKQFLFKSSTKETHVKYGEKAKERPDAEIHFSEREEALTTNLAKTAKWKTLDFCKLRGFRTDCWSCS